jgi:hypothetical protein
MAPTRPVRFSHRYASGERGSAATTLASTGSSSGATAVVAISWVDRQGEGHRWAHVVKLENGKIVDIQDYASAMRAAAVVRLRAVFG